MKEHNKKQSMWISVSCYGSTSPLPQRLLCWPRCTGHYRSLLGPSVLGKGSLKAEPNYFSSLALNIF